MRLRRINFGRGLKKPSEISSVVDVSDAGRELPPLPYWVGPSPVINMPAELLVMQGGHGYTSAHPFVMALEKGPEALADFYRSFVPRNLADMYGLKLSGRVGEDLAPWELPWLLRSRQAPPGERKLGPEHGVSYYGPCTPEKVELEHRRLRSIVQSIEKMGYKPEEYGHIRGHFLQAGRDFRFFVRGGKHRAAALVFLGYQRIPVRMKESWPRVINRTASQDWPLVHGGEMTQEVAEEIFDSYFSEKVDATYDQQIADDK